MADWRDDITSYDIPENALLIDDGPNGGQHWVHLKTAEQLAMVLYRSRDFEIREVAGRGGVSEGTRNDPEGFVALLDHNGKQLLMGSYLFGDIQWPTGPGISGDKARDIFADQIAFLKEYADDLLNDRILQNLMHP